MTTTLVTPAMEKQTVAVTGGCGFLGQHLIKLLHTNTTNVQCVRVLDFMAFNSELEYEPMVEMHSIVGSVTSMEDLLTATDNVTTVFHLASISDNHMFPDRDILQLVNVEGTRNVIEACKLNGVKNLIYVSDVTVVKDHNSIIKGTEGTTCYPANHLHLDGWSKCEAEKLVLSANGDPLGQDMSEDSGTLKTVAIRLLTLYGEMDSSLLPHVVGLATANDGHLVCVGSMKSKSHMMYVGNAAWALICAFTKLNKSEESPVTTKSNQATDDTRSHISGTSTSKAGRSIAERFAAATKARTPAKEDPHVTQQQPADAAEREDAEEVVVEGKAYFVCDDTRPRNFFLIMQPILVRYGFFLTSWVVPERWAKVIYMLVYVMLWLAYPLIHYNPNLSFGNIHELCRTYTFKDTLARKNLDYSPIFTRKDAFLRTVRMYDLKYKEAMYGCLENRALTSSHVALLRQMPKLKRLITSLDLSDNGRRFRAKATRQYEMTLPW